MTLRATRWAKSVALTGIILAVAACGSLPRVGPTKTELTASSVENEGDAYIVPVDNHVVQATHYAPKLGFSSDFRNAGILGPDTIQAGDRLSLTVWENVDDGLLSGPVPGQSILEHIQVDGSGFIFVPYAGRLRAAGNTPEALRRLITDKLEEQTPDPQVEVRRVAGDGSTVSMVGLIGAQGVYPIDRPTRTLSGMLARAGGIVIPPETALITVIRGHMRGTIWFGDLYSSMNNDIALRNGDRILIEQDTRSYTALGATGGQRQIKFESHTLNAVEALAQVGGLQAQGADPTGVFILRDEDPKVVNSVLNRVDIATPQRMIYVLDLTQPNGMFLARDFSIRDGDTIYVTEAPFNQWAKVLQALTGTFNTISSISRTSDLITGD